MNLADIELQRLGALALIMLLPLIVYLNLRYKLTPYLQFTYGKSAKIPQFTVLLRRIIIVVLFLLLILSLAFPVQHQSHVRQLKKGHAISIVVDVSKSMQAMDFKPNRLDYAKEIGSKYLHSMEKSNQVSIVPFGSVASIFSPVTSNKAISNFILSQLYIGIIDGDQSAIGTALAQGVYSLRNNANFIKHVVLITDGSSVGAGIDFEEVKKYAKDEKVKLHIIAIGNHGKIPFPIIDLYGNEQIVKIENDLDSTILKGISKETNGRFYHIENQAQRPPDLSEIFNKFTIIEQNFVEEEPINPSIFKGIAILLFLLLIVEVFIRNPIGK
jgi:Ca-activated chloride channel homolog